MRIGTTRVIGLNEKPSAVPKPYIQSIPINNEARLMAISQPFLNTTARIIKTIMKAAGSKMRMFSLLASMISFIIKLIPITRISVDWRSNPVTMVSMRSSVSEKVLSWAVIPCWLSSSSPREPLSEMKIMVPFAWMMPPSGLKSLVSSIENMPFTWGGVKFEERRAVMVCLIMVSFIF